MTLDVTGSPTDTKKLYVILAPKITASELKAKTYGASQMGAIFHVTAQDLSPSGQTIDVTSTGYYFFNGDSSVN